MLEEAYVGREQSYVKHFVLKKYLERFAHIVGSKFDSITYVDGFAGPWNVRSEGLEDSSFGVALAELEKARITHIKRGKNLKIRCVFMEADPVACQKLRQFAAGVKNAEIEVIPTRFEDGIPAIRAFIEKGRSTFPFVFIDPTGWTGFPLKIIAPLLKHEPCEVLINFMTSFARRFTDHDGSRQSFTDLLGEELPEGTFAALTGVDRDEALVGVYIRRVQAEANFQFACPTLVLHPQHDRTHFHLVYLTRHRRGVEVFKNAEEQAMAEMERVRARAQERRREEATGIRSLFADQVTPDGQHYLWLRDRYLERAQNVVTGRLESLRQVSYEEAWGLAMSQPLVWESDLKDWIQTWQQQGRIELVGLEQRERVPKLGKGHVLRMR